MYKRQSNRPGKALDPCLTAAGCPPTAFLDMARRYSRYSRLFGEGGQKQARVGNGQKKMPGALIFPHSAVAGCTTGCTGFGLELPTPPPTHKQVRHGPSVTIVNGSPEFCALAHGKALAMPWNRQQSPTRRHSTPTTFLYTSLKPSVVMCNAAQTGPTLWNLAQPLTMDETSPHQITLTRLI